LCLRETSGGREAEETGVTPAVARSGEVTETWRYSVRIILSRTRSEEAEDGRFGGSEGAKRSELC
jgi:hypothetical protein